MIGLLQRVSAASVAVESLEIARIGCGLLVLVGIRPADDEGAGHRLLRRILDYRIFADERGKMALSLRQIEGELLLVPQFTLTADTRTGLRPGFSTAAGPDLARRLFDRLLTDAQMSYSKVQSGQFGAHMRVTLVNDGPVTLWLES